MALIRLTIAGLAIASTIGLSLVSPQSTGLTRTSVSVSDAQITQPPEQDGPPVDYFPCNEAYDGATMKWRGAWWKCDVVIEAERKWEWEYWGDQDPNLA
jgi:hypothetical protein